MPRPAIFRVEFRGVLTEAAQRALAADGLDFHSADEAATGADGTAHVVDLVAAGADDARRRVEKALSGQGSSVAYEVEPISG